MNIIFQRAFWLGLAGASVVAVVAAMPVLMSNVMQRSFDLPKQSLAEPLAVLAFGAVLLAVGWQWIMRESAATKIAAGSLVVFLLLAIISTVLAENLAAAFFGSYYRREGLLAWWAYAAFFFALLGWAHHTRQVGSFLDVLLLSSVIAAAYAIQQRLELDFYPPGLRDLKRPSGTLGNPLFLAAYLAILLPITITRCWQARRALFELAPWLAVAVFQVGGILVTQSRGPLLAAMLGMLLLAACCAGRAQARRVFVLAFVTFAAVAASLVAINTLPVARHWAQDVPVVARLVFNLDPAAGDLTQVASRSAASRPAVWSAGVETFSAAPLDNKLLGYGPESAANHYLQHVPASLMSLVGYGQSNTFDRMHADTLEIGLNFGALAWLAYSIFFGSVMYAAARALWGLSGRAAPWTFVLVMCAGGAFSAAAAVRLGFASAAAPAFGLGIGGGWLLFMLVCAWRRLKRDAPAMSAAQTQRWILLAGLTSSLWIFWVDAQISIPVSTTRVISFGIAALILITAGRTGRDTEADEGPATIPAIELRVWGIACALVAVCASCLPIVLPDPGADVHWLRRALPLLIFLPVAAWAGWAQARRGGGSTHRTGRAWLALAVGAPLVYSASHLALMMGPAAAPTVDQAWRIALLSYAGTLFIFALCVSSAWLAARGGLQTDASAISRTARWSIGVVASAVLLVAVAGWHARLADVAAVLASRVADKQPQASERLLEEAIRLQPHERRFRQKLVDGLLDKAVSEIREIDAASQPSAEIAQRIRAMLRNLDAAESTARKAALLFPRDPWVVFALANVLQVKALRVLRPLDADGGARAAREANELFDRAHRMFPAEPVMVRNRAQLLADQGNLAEAYRLFDLMEKLIPNDAEPYVARIVAAQQVSDNKTITDTLERARAALAPDDFSRVLGVANLQRK